MRLAALVLAAVVAAGSTAHADDSYHGSLAIPDGIALGFGIAAANDARVGQQDKLVEVALAAYLAGAPAIHAFHHHGYRAANSLALRVGVPLFAAVIGGKLALWDEGCYSGHDCTDGNNEGGGRTLGVIVGALAAMAIDNVLWGKEREHPQPPRLIPTASPFPNGGVTFGVAGTL